MKVEINRNATIDVFKESLHNNILKTLELKEWKKYRNFKVYVSLKGLGDNVCVVRPECFSYLYGSYNPFAFVSVSISRKAYNEWKEDIFEYFVKYCK